MASLLVQLDPGDLGLASIDVRGRDSFVIRFKTGARSLWTMVPDRDWIGYLVPITWKGDYLLNGMSATRDTVFRLDGAHEYDVVAERRDAITVGIRRSVLARTISSLVGRDFNLDVDTHRHSHVPERHRKRLLGIFWKSISGAALGGSGSSFLKMTRSSEGDLIDAVANWIIETDELDIHERSQDRSELRIVRETIRGIRQAEHSALSIADLCQIAGVGKSRLHQAFSEIHGVSPGTYLYRLRLTSIREKLLSDEEPPRLIKDVAIEHGFLSSGQFARAYRNMFGELPGETMEKRKLPSV